MMLSLTYPNVELSRMGLDWVGCGCSSSRGGISLVGSWDRKYGRWGRRPERMLCRGKVARSGVCSAQIPDTVRNDVLDAATLEDKSKSSSPISISSLLEAVADDLKTLNKNLKTVPYVKRVKFGINGRKMARPQRNGQRATSFVLPAGVRTPDTGRVRLLA